MAVQGDEYLAAVPLGFGAGFDSFSERSSRERAWRCRLRRWARTASVDCPWLGAERCSALCLLETWPRTAMPDRRSPRSRPRRQITRAFSGRSCGPSEGGHRLHEWFWTGADAGYKGVSGRLAGVNVARSSMSSWPPGRSSPAGSFEPAGGWGGDHHNGVPIVVLGRQEPDIDTGAVAAGYLCVRRRNRDDRGQAGCGREERSSLRSSWAPRSSSLID
jgi:hypothetical protein